MFERDQPIISAVTPTVFRSCVPFALLAAVFGLVAAPSQVAEAKTGARLPRPQVSQLTATRVTIPAAGGTTTITARISGASLCEWRVGWSPGPTFKYSSFDCHRASSPFLATYSWTLLKNPEPMSRTGVVTLFAYTVGGGPPRVAVARIEITQDAGAAQPGVVIVPYVLPPTSATPPPAPLTTPPTPMTTITTPPAPAPARGPSHSANWSGYAVLSGSTPVTDVGARWTVPTLNCSARRDGGVGIWVGIGGIEGRSGPLLQTGVDLNCGNGAQFDNAFFEEVPPTTRNQTYGFANFPIAAGDSISGSVYQETNGNWVTRLDDLTTGRSGWMVSGEAWGVGRDGASTFTNRGPTTKLTYSGGYSAEWIVEAYQLRGITSPLANYGTVNFNYLTTSLSPWHLTPDEQVQMVRNGTTLSTPSASSDNGFSVNYTR